MAAPFRSRAPRSTRDPSRAGAVWVAGTGAFLLLAAAAVFVASNWDHIPPPAKLAAVGLLTGAFLLAGRSLRGLLPATSGVLWHLGAFLIPVDVAAVGVHLGASTAELALATGLVSAAGMAALERAWRSPLLAGGSAVGVVVATAGLGALVPVPAALSLAVLAAVAGLAGAPRLATGWALVAGAAPLGIAVAGADTAGWAATVGLIGDVAGWSSLASGALSAAVLWAVASRREEPVLAVLGLAALTIGAVGTTRTAALPADGNLALAAGALLAVEVAAALLRRDPFWSRLAGPVALGAEVVAALGTVAAFGVLDDVLAFGRTQPLVVGGHVVETGSPAAGLALVLTAATWLVADVRRAVGRQGVVLTLVTGGGFAPTAPALATCAVAAAGIAGGPPAVALALGAVAGALVCTGRPLAHATAAVAVAVAPIAGRDEPALAAGLGVAGALLLAWAVALRVQTRDDRPGEADAIWLLGGSAVLPLTTAAVVLLEPWPTLPVLAGATVAAWAAAALLDVGDDDPRTRHLGLVARSATLVPLLAPGLASNDRGALAALVLALVVEESARRDDPATAAPAVVAAPVLVLSTAAALDASPAASGLALTTLGAVAAVAAVATSRRWAGVPTVLAGVAVALGGLLVTDDPTATASFLVLAGSTVLGLGAIRRESPLAWVGGVVATIGGELHLALAEVQLLEPYVAPVGVLLLVAGAARRGPVRRDGREPVSSWVAYGPALVLVGGAALVERLDGGGSSHAVVATAVGVGAVLAGGWRRLAGPLLLGTALLVGVVAHESLAFTSDMPTWVWLAVGGSVLLAGGVALERTDTSPAEGGRRLVEAITDRFD